MKTRDERIEEAANDHADRHCITKSVFGHKTPSVIIKKSIIPHYKEGAHFGIILGREEMLKEFLKFLRYSEHIDCFGLIARFLLADIVEDKFKAEPQESKEIK